MKWTQPIGKLFYVGFSDEIRTNAIKCCFIHSHGNGFCSWEEIPSDLVGDREYFWRRIDAIGKYVMSTAKHRGWL